MTKPSSTLVGAFVLGALALVAAGVVFFGGGALLEKKLPIVSFFQGSVAGLQVGAPVTFRGVKVGEVKATGISINPTTGSSIIQVYMEIQPQTVTVDGQTLAYDQNFVPTLVKSGLSAQLVTQSFVTGLVNVDLDFRPGDKLRTLGTQTLVPEVPTVPTNLEALKNTLQSVDIGSVLEAVKTTLDSMNGVLSSPGVKQTLNDLPGMLGEVRQTLKTMEKEVATLSATGQEAIQANSGTLKKTLESLQSLSQTLDTEGKSTLVAARGSLQNADRTLQNADRALQNANRAIDGAAVMFDPRSRTMVDIQRAVEDFSIMAARLRDLSERIDRNPGILIRGR